MTTLENSYCVPKTEEEFNSLPFYSDIKYKGSLPVITSEGDSYCYIAYFGTGDRAEISVSHFRDLIHDRIAPWRLKEVGFVPFPDEHNTAMMRWENDAQYTVEVIGGGVYVNNASYNITTFTELLTLIKFLTPPTK